jgi:hypothetical protein
MSQNKLNAGHWLLLIVGGVALGNLIFESISPCPNRLVIVLWAIVATIEFGIFHFFTINKEKSDVWINQDQTEQK